jgi:hypothetical protein
MKHMSRSSDPYVELVLLHFTPNNSSGDHSNAVMMSPNGRTQQSPQSPRSWKDNIHEIMSRFTDIEYDILTGNCVIKADTDFSIIEQHYQCSPQVTYYYRTSVQVSSFLLFTPSANVLRLTRTVSSLFRHKPVILSGEKRSNFLFLQKIVLKVLHLTQQYCQTHPVQL